MKPKLWKRTVNEEEDKGLQGLFIIKKLLPNCTLLLLSIALKTNKMVTALNHVTCHAERILAPTTSFNNVKIVYQFIMINVKLHVYGTLLRLMSFILHVYATLPRFMSFILHVYSTLPRLTSFIIYLD